MKHCTKCCRDLTDESFSKDATRPGGLCIYCRECYGKLRKEYYRTHPHKRVKANELAKLWNNRNNERCAYNHYSRRLKIKYGMSVEEHRSLVSSGRCELCGRQDSGHGSLCIDHDHNTNEVRGTLCAVCNLWLGAYEKLIEKVGEDTIKKYLRRRQSDEKVA